MKRYLPIGSVVLLKGSERRMMIVGVKQRQVDTGKVWDYSACLYPQGIIDPDQLYLFDEDQIDMLFFIGFQDGESLKFQQLLQQADAKAE